MTKNAANNKSTPPTAQGVIEKVDGDHPLHAAAAMGSKDICKILLAHGADPLARNNKNETAEDVACAHNHKDCADAIRAYSELTSGREIKFAFRMGLTKAEDEPPKKPNQLSSRLGSLMGNLMQGAGDGSKKPSVKQK